MIWRGVSRTEWRCAALVTTVSLASTLLLLYFAASVDDITLRRHARLEQLAGFSTMTTLPRADAVGDLADLFAGHVLTPEPAPWGAFFALRASSPQRGSR